MTSKSLLFGVLTGIAGVAAALLPFGADFEGSAGLDLLFHLRGARKAPTEVVVVAVDRESSDAYGLPPDPRKWPRSLHGRLVDKLSEAGASVIAFDFFFEESRDPADDRKFADSVSRAGNVVLCERLRDDPVGRGAGGVLTLTKAVPLMAPLSGAAAAVASYPLPKVPYKVSRDWLFTKEGREGPTLPVVAFHVYALPAYGEFRQRLAALRPDAADRLPRDGEELKDGRRIEETARTIRDLFDAEPSLEDRMKEGLRRAGPPKGGPREAAMLSSLVGIYGGDVRKYLNFYGPPRTLSTVSFHRIVPPEGRDPDRGPPLPDFKGKAVFVGMSDISQMDQKDSFYTVFSQPNGLDISGVEIAATSFANLLEVAPVRPKKGIPLLAILFLWGLAAGFLCRHASPLPAALGIAALCVLYLSASVREFSAAGVSYPVAVPLFLQAPLGFLGAVLWRYVDTNRERRNIRMALGYYLPAPVVDRLAKDIAGMTAENRVVHGIVLNTDVEGYTELAENRDPKELGRLMNRYYEAVFRPVREHGGEVSNVVGDSMLAIWVSADPDPALRGKACEAALGVARSIEDFNRTPGLPALPTRVGLHAGPLFLGNLGGGDHYEYRPLGDIVNTASRIEGLNKYLGTRILLSGEMTDRLDGFLTREIGTFRFLGKSRPLCVHELIVRTAEANGQATAGCEAFHAGLEAFRRKSWDEAESRFREAAGIFGDDGPSRFYGDLCARYRLAPPGEEWDGSVAMDRK